MKRRLPPAAVPSIVMMVWGVIAVIHGFNVHAAIFSTGTAVLWGVKEIAEWIVKEIRRG